MWILLIPFISSSQIIGVCPSYKCHQGGQDWGNTCYKPVGDDYEFQICDGNLGKYCNIRPNAHTEAVCEQVPDKKRDPGLPGEHCTSGSDCISNTCTSSVCIGTSLGGYCVSHADCDVGLYCNPGNICAPQLSLQSTCSSDWDCVNSMACNRTMYDNGNCVPYYTLKAGDPVGMCMTFLSETISNLCETGACQQLNPFTNGEGRCTEPFVSNSIFPTTCLDDSDCTASNGSLVTSGNCDCGMDRDGQAYCNSWAGDEISVKVKNYRKAHLTSVNLHDCHTMERFQDYCMVRTLNASAYQDYLRSHLLAQDPARYTNNDYCTQKIMNSDYWTTPTYQYQCKAYTCGSEQELVQGTCISYAQGINTLKIQNCTDPNMNFCNLTESMENIWMNVTCKALPETPDLYPGDKCNTTTQCIYGNCQSGYCSGTALGASCSVNQQCAVGSYCALVWNSTDLNYTTSCQALIPKGQSGCGNDYECSANSGCNITSTSIPGTCLDYFSVKEGEKVVCPQSGMNYWCLTGTCYNTEGEMGVCVAAPKLEGTHPQECYTSRDCAGFSDQMKFQGACQCGYNLYGKSYCLPFGGDEQGQAYITQLRMLLTYNDIDKTCQTTRRYSTDCWTLIGNKLALDNVDLLYVNSFNYTNYAEYVDNQECVIDVITNNFWSKVKDVNPFNPDPPIEDDFGSFLSAGILVLALI